MVVLDVRELAVSRGGSRVLGDVTFTVQPGDCLAVLGRNGAGKTTLVEAIMRLIKTEAGQVAYRGVDISHWTTRRLARAGVSFVPTGRKLFWNLSVQQNLAIGAHQLHWWWRGPRPSAYDAILELFPDLRDLWTRQVRTLSGGQQQMVAVARALMSKPDLIILDEPTAGLSPRVVQAIVERLLLLRQEGLSVLLLEQNVDVATDVASKVALLSRGEIVAEGTPSVVLDSSEFGQALFGQVTAEKT